MDAELKEIIQGLIQEPDFMIHKILSKQCINREDVAGPAIRLCQTMIQDALTHAELFTKDMAG
jgi:hypothetical protein